MLQSITTVVEGFSTLNLGLPSLAGLSFPNNIVDGSPQSVNSSSYSEITRVGSSLTSLPLGANKNIPTISCK